MQCFGCSTSSECNLSHIQDSCCFPRCLIFHLLLIQQSLEIAAFRYLLSNACRSGDFQLPSLCPALVYEIILVDTNFAWGDQFMCVWKSITSTGELWVLCRSCWAGLVLLLLGGGGRWWGAACLEQEAKPWSCSWELLSKSPGCHWVG